MRTAASDSVPWRGMPRNGSVTRRLMEWGGMWEEASTAEEGFRAKGLRLRNG